jgi:hypothetical protein
MDQTTHSSSGIPIEEGQSGQSGASSPEAAKDSVKPLQKEATTLRNEVLKLHLAEDGDNNERLYWPIIKEQFPNYERFWRLLVNPLTCRIERELGDPARIQRRDGISEDVWIVSYLNYSLFLHLTAASDHLPGPLNSSFSDFYTHLGSACELAEDFLLQAYLVICECRGEIVPVLQELSKDEFLKIAEKWYDKRYARLYENYHNKGKGSSIYLPARSTILQSYFTSDRQAAWNAYELFANAIRPYRNRIVHDVAMGNVIVGKIPMVPRKERIQDYRSLQQVKAATHNIKQLKKDFVVREEQMFNDFQELQKHLNELWEFIIADFCNLLYEDTNPVMMKKYNLVLT